MRKIFNAGLAIALGTICLPLSAAASAAPVSSWYGRYIWEEPLGRIGGATPAEGAAAFVTYRLTLGRAGGPTGCLLSGEGFQTFKQLRCTATLRGNAIIVKYYGTAGQSPRITYRRGAPLFTLTRTGRGIVTQLLGLEPSSDASPGRGRLFHYIG